jgi:hypothetical protein
MSKAYFELDAAGKKALADKHGRPEGFASAKSVEEKTVETTTTIAPAPVEEVVVEEEVVAEETTEEEHGEYPLNQD